MQPVAEEEWCVVARVYFVSAVVELARSLAQILGDTLDLIAREKAGIMKPGVPCITCALPPPPPRNAHRTVSTPPPRPTLSATRVVPHARARGRHAALPRSTRQRLRRLEKQHAGWWCVRSGTDQTEETMRALREEAAKTGTALWVAPAVADGEAGARLVALLRTCGLGLGGEGAG